MCRRHSGFPLRRRRSSLGRAVTSLTQVLFPGSTVLCRVVPRILLSSEFKFWSPALPSDIRGTRGTLIDQTFGYISHPYNLSITVLKPSVPMVAMDSKDSNQSTSDHCDNVRQSKAAGNVDGNEVLETRFAGKTYGYYED